MASPFASFIQLPSDTANTGKKDRTQTRVVGADTVHEHFFVPLNPRSVLGVYYLSSPILIPPSIAADNGTTTGRFWVLNPAGSGVSVYIHSIKCSQVITDSFTADTVAPRLAFGRVSFDSSIGLGPVQNQIAYAKRDSTDATPVSGATLQAAGTGTIVLNGMIRADIAPTNTGTTGAGQCTPYISPEREFTWDEMLLLRAGEGLVCYYADASGITSSKRRSTVDLIIEEAL